MPYPVGHALDVEATVAIAKALAHPARIQIVELLASQPACRGAEVFSELPLAQSTVSEHLRVLKEAGIVSASRTGTSTVYCLRTGGLDALVSTLTVLTGMYSSDDCGSDAATAASDSCEPTDSGEGACS